MRKVLLGLLFPLAALFALSAVPPEPRDVSWKKVDQAMKKGLPKTAIKELDGIVEGALKDKAYAEAIKAIGRKIALEGNIQGNKPEEKIVRLQAEIAKAPEEMQPVMEAILAHWYWHYFQNNRWRFLQRTQTAEPPGDDFTTWDLARLFEEIDKHFTAALVAKDLLQKTPIAEYDALLEKGTMSDAYRPTLYDFVVHQALEFYSSGEQGLARAEDAFDLSADSPIFASTAEFLKWGIETTDERSPTVKAIRLYQDLLRFHENDDDRTAFLDADLLRLQFGNNSAFGEEKSPRYKAALKRFTEQWADHEISARALHEWASALHQEQELVEAHRIAAQGMKRFPDCVGGKLCYNLIQQIEGKSVQITTERVWNAPAPTINVRYRNITEVHFRVVAYDWAQSLHRGSQRPEYLDRNEQLALLARRPALEWSADLPATDDYQERVEEIPAQLDLAPGFYFLVASHDPSFREQDNQVSFTDFWVSDLALVMREHRGKAVLEGFVLQAGSGEPIAGAEIRMWRSERKRWVAVHPTRTDKNGLFRFEGDNRSNYLILARHGDQQLASANTYHLRRYDRRPKPQTRTVFFTDRSLYRPGQTVHYKGLCISADQSSDNYQVLARQSLTVVFRDANNKEIASQQHQSNDYGSFSGSFTAPRDRLMGRMSIRVESGPNGRARFNVEEYKRPKFRVTLDAPEKAGRLNADVVVQGKAMAYTGAAVDGAKVRWRVVRRVRYPIWWSWRFWWMPPRPEPEQEIAHGTATTAADGTFDVKFVARPDLSVSEKDEPIFHYTVSADVTDTAGETRSDQRTIRLGYTALQAWLHAEEWQTDEKPVEISIRTTTLDNEGQQAEGSLKVYRLKQPETVVRQSLQGHFDSFPFLRGIHSEPKSDPSNPNSWPLGDLVAEIGFTTDMAGNSKHSFKLDAGPYRALLTTQDCFGKPVTAQLPLRVLAPKSEKFGIKIPDVMAAPKWTAEPGEKFTALWGSGYDRARAFVEIEHRGKVLKAYWTQPGRTQTQIAQPVTEAMRGGFTVRVTMVRENRPYFHSQYVSVPWTNKNLTVKWEHFVSKLQPGQKETWTAIVTGPDAKRAVAEMVAALYDASLDAYLPHSWQTHFGVFRHDHSNLAMRFENHSKGLRHLHGQWPVDRKDVTITYRSFPNEITANLWGYQFYGGRGVRRGFGVGGMGMPVPSAPAAAMPMEMEAAAAPKAAMSLDAAADGFETLREAKGGAMRKSAAEDKSANAGASQPPGPDLSQVSARQNLNETAFFFPHLVSDSDGEVKLEFTMPEALTEWRFLGFVHDKELRAGYLEDRVVTAKDLMIQPNPPRFLREGDVLEFTVKVTNQSAARQTGSVRLTLADARTRQNVDQTLGNVQTDQSFDVPSKESRTYSWRLSVPDGAGFLTYKAVGSTGKLSDGEEGYLPVLSRRILVTESLPLPIRGPQTKQFRFDRLAQSGESDTLRHQSLTVQMVSQPAWYAVMALPYLMEFPYECAEQVFNRLYANSLGRHIVQSDPKIRRVFEQWRATPTLDSPLEKNQDLKAVMLEETPWVRQAESESQARRNVGVLFDDNRLNDEMRRAFQKLTDMQLADGAWPWFPGGRGNDYITLYIVTGFGRLRHLGADIDVAPAVKALTRLDSWIDETYRRILERGHKDECHLSATIALYLYGRSFFIDDQPIASQPKEAVDYFLGQAKTYWLKLANRQSQAHLAIALKRFGDRQTPQDIMRSISERSVHNDELCMFWRELERSWWWYRAPIETQAMMIEAFDEVMNDAQAVEDCKVWLLKQKQTQDWKTTKATADAVYALLLRGTDLLASDALVEVSLGGEPIRPENVEAGTGFYEHRFAGSEIKPQFGEITVKKVDQGVSWGSVHWQYLEDMSKVTPYEGTPLTLKKNLYTKQNTKKGPVLVPVNGPLHVGDELVVRIELRVDRDMEYVHMKDQRGSGTEPVNVLSRYKYQDGLAYYESTRDTASHFFIDYLPKGVYVFEYSTRVVHKGRYQTGMAQIQCMYAPEFNSHSESFVLDVKSE